jgi:dihydroorotate dehydrogenase electron transfer subunit
LSSPPALSENSPALFRAKVRENKKISEGHYLLELTPAPFAIEAIHPAPGQFFMLGLPGRKDPLLKRPFGYFSAKDGSIRFLYRVRGRMTAMMSSLEEGDEMEVLGPLGNYYPIFEKGPKRGKAPLVVAGGTGIASLYPLIEAMKGRAVVFYGGRNADELLFTEELRELARELVLAAEEGGTDPALERGTAIDSLNRYFKGRDKRQYVLYACGPMGMLKAASGMGFEGYVSVEERMACGIGVCLGCAVKTRRTYKRACKEGPVFAIGEAVFE